MAIHDLAMDSYQDTGILFVCICADSIAWKLLSKDMGMSKLLILKAYLPEKFYNDDLFVISSKVQIFCLTVVSKWQWSKPLVMGSFIQTG